MTGCASSDGLRISNCRPVEEQLIASYRFGMDGMYSVGQRISMIAGTVMTGNALIRVKYYGVAGVMGSQSQGAMAAEADVGTVNFLFHCGRLDLEELKGG